MRTRVAVVVDDECEPLAAVDFLEKICCCGVRPTLYILSQEPQVPSNDWRDAHSLFDTKITTLDNAQSTIAAWINEEKQSVVALSSSKISKEALSSEWCSSGAIFCCLKANLVDAFPDFIQGISKQMKPPALLVGVAMKRSRFVNLVERGILSLDLCEKLIFFPLDFGIRLSTVDAVLHKATDGLEIKSKNHDTLKVEYSSAIKDLQEDLKQTPVVCVLDSFSSVSKVADRSVLAEVLNSMECALAASGVIRKCLIPPQLNLVAPSRPDYVHKSMSDAGVEFPVIVKTSIACGVPLSHDHVVLQSLQEYKDAELTFPCCIQSYINHYGFQFKIYVVGCKVFYRVEIINPDKLYSLSVPKSGSASSCRESSNGEVSSVPMEDSSLQIAHHSVHCKQIDEGFVGWIDNRSSRNELACGLDICAILGIAKYVKEQTGLTIFGFDVLESVSGAYFVIDVNYFPSCKNITGVQRAIRGALFEKIVCFKRTGYH